MHLNPPLAELGQFLIAFQAVEASLVELIIHSGGVVEVGTLFNNLIAAEG